jgi:serine acetyltransferase
VVGANAVVLNNVLPFHVAIGIPAKILLPKNECIQGVGTVTEE